MTNVAQRPVGRSDAELARLARDGDVEAWAVIVERYAPYVHAIAVRAFGLPEPEADEVFQVVFRRLYDDLGSHVGELGELRGPVGRLARVLCLERHGGAAVAPSEAVVLLQIEAAMDIQGALGSIERSGRDLLRRFFVRNQSYRAIAHDLDLPVTAIPGRIARALDDLCDAIASENPDVA